ncbi:hypothetical protein thsps21_60590 [Pseudomonas sp. No.21]|jgi:hypothetical protein|uniref:hypothetical protein n=1 Tax=Pseudomonas TaxID=286 RepID=UPI000DA81877|nr:MULTISPECIES: hypothetical protein [Pseudomonas]MDW3714083.1 hypothetical protein [Pseudomonas sp. 2023EL-01195]PZE09632.1 hypothetical protein DMX10_30155 [Pseudomonas sp. 57B-090624]GJN50207.1 hypothetical protein TUM20249_61930 [Pseudomonas tohonis]
MAWNRRAPEAIVAPEPLSTARWLGAGLLMAVVGIVFFMLAAAGEIPVLGTFNTWMLSALPLLLWLLAFSARAYRYGRALGRFQFLTDEAAEAGSAWNQWAQRNMAVLASCVVLPDQISAAALAQGADSLPPRIGTARRIVSLPAEVGRLQVGLDLLLKGVQPMLAGLTAEHPVQVTLLSDLAPEESEQLRSAWDGCCERLVPELATVVPRFAHALSPDWIEASLKKPGTHIDLILVLQVNGEEKYSDGLAALLLCPDVLADLEHLTVEARLLRPMPLALQQLDQELPLFLQTQSQARSATAILADSMHWKASLATLLSLNRVHGGELRAECQWIQESLSGLPGPMSHWLAAALGADMARHRQRPLLLITREGSQHWISTLTTGGSA